MDFDYKKIKMNDLAILGFKGSGLVNESSSWTSELWFDLDEELESLEQKLGQSKERFTFWGVMSDSQEWLAPWNQVGIYLAGVEVPLDFIDAEEETKYSVWILPAMEYIVVETTVVHVEEAVTYIFEQVLEVEDAEVIGAIQECYPKESFPGEIALYFPIRML